jgi:hypothetical protein
MKLEIQGSSDKKQYFSLRFSLPISIVKPIQGIAYSIRKWKYKLFPDRCDCCGAKMYVKSYTLSHVFSNSANLSIQNIAHKPGTYSSYFVCRECIVRELEAGEWTPRFTALHGEDKNELNLRFWKKDVCEVTGKQLPSYRDVEIVPYISMLFCVQAWNYNRVSKEAVLECARYGNVDTNVWGVYKGKMARRNHKMLYVDDQGKLL